MSDKVSGAGYIDPGTCEIDLAEAITIKMDFNETRPRRHGGKAL